MNPLPRTTLASLLAVFALVADAASQETPAPGTQGGATGANGLLPPGQGTPPGAGVGQPQAPGAAAYGADPANSQWVLPRTGARFQGWPVFPSQLRGYAGYPGLLGAPVVPTAPPGTAAAPGGAVPVPFPGLPLTLGAAALPPEPPPGWPAWSRLAGKQALPFAADQGLLVRHGERVWLQTEADEPFVPIPYHDKLRTVHAGARVEVRQAGEFELLLHDSTRLFARGPTLLTLDTLSPEAVQVDLQGLTWLRLGAVGRAHTLVLPDRSTLHVAAAKPAEGAAEFTPSPGPVTTPTLGVTDLVFERADQPEWRAGRATLTNLGSTDVTWRRPGGDIVVPPLHRVMFFLAPSAAPIGGDLQLVGCYEEPAATGTVVRSQTGGTASWSGARFAVPAGGSVVFEPLQGQPKLP